MEVLVASALLVLILSAGYSLFSAGYNLFWTNEDRTSTQSNVQLVAEYIVNQVRNARQVEVISHPFTAEESYSYLFLEEGRLKHMQWEFDTHLTEEIYISDDVLKGLVFDLELSRLLGIEITGIKELDDASSPSVEQSYAIKTAVFLQNIRFPDAKRDVVLAYSFIPGSTGPGDSGGEGPSIPSALQYMIDNEVAIFASTAGDDDEAVQILGSTGICHAVGANASSFDSFSFGNVSMHDTVYLAIEQNYHLGLSEWENRGYNAGSEVLFNGEMYRAIGWVNAQPGTHDRWVRFAPLTGVQHFPEPDVDEFPSSPSLSGAVTISASGDVRLGHYGEGGLLYLPNATRVYTNNNTQISRSIYAPNAEEVALGTGNTINGFIHAPDAKLISGNGTDIDGYIYVDGSERHVLTGTSVNGTIFLSNIDAEGQLINPDAEFHLTGNVSAKEGFITHVVSNGTNIRLEADHIHGLVYAPGADVKLLGSSSVKGSIVAYTIEVNGSKVGGKCNVIFDEDIVLTFPFHVIQGS